MWPTVWRQISSQSVKIFLYILLTYNIGRCICTNLTSIYWENTLIPLACTNCPANVNVLTSIMKVMSRQTAGFVSNSCESNRGTLQTVFEETKLISHHSIELRESWLEMTNNPVQSRCLRTVLSTQPISIRVGHHQRKDLFIFKLPFRI